MLYLGDLDVSLSLSRSKKKKKRTFSSSTTGSKARLASVRSEFCASDGNLNVRSHSASRGERNSDRKFFNPENFPSVGSSLCCYQFLKNLSTMNGRTSNSRICAVYKYAKRQAFRTFVYRVPIYMVKVYEGN